MQATFERVRILASGIYGEDRGEPMRRPSGSEIYYVDVYDQGQGAVARYPVAEALNAEAEALRNGGYVDLTADVRQVQDARMTGGGDSQRAIAVQKVKVTVTSIRPAQEALPDAA